MLEPGSAAPLVFAFNRWLARDMDDGDMCRELPAIRPGKPIPQGKLSIYMLLWLDNIKTRSHLQKKLYNVNTMTEKLTSTSVMVIICSHVLLRERFSPCILLLVTLYVSSAKVRGSSCDG